MPASVEGIVFGRLAIGKGFISEDTLFSCLKTCQKNGEVGQDPVSLNQVLVREGYLTPDQVEEIEEVLQRIVREEPISGYKIHREVQYTEYGVIYRASQISLSRPVNILFLFPLAVNDRKLINRFDQEARTLCGLNHSGVIQGIDVGEEDNAWYFVTEYVQGKSLNEYIDEQGTIDETEVFDYVLQTARALRALEETGMEHGDINPEHILINQDGITKLIGFPLAMKEPRYRRLEAGVLPASLHYMSPEYVSNGTIDVRSDLYALGASMYHALTGQKPFQEMDVEDIVQRDTNSRSAAPVLLHKPEIKSGLSAVIEKLMRPDPEYRYQNPEDLVVDLELISDGLAPEHVNVRDHLRQYQLVRDSSRDRPTSYLGTVFNKMVEDPRIHVAVAVFALFVVVFSYVRFSSSKPVPTADQTTGIGVDESEESNEKGSNPDQTSNRTSVSTGKDTDDDEDTSQQDTSVSGREPMFTDPENRLENFIPEQIMEDDQEQNHLKDGKRESEQDSLHDRFLQLKASIHDFQGGISKVEDFVSRIDDMMQQAESRDLKSDLRQLRSRFLSKQAEQILDRRMKMDEVEQADIERLAKIYQRLNRFPQIFRETFTWNVVQKRKVVVREEIEYRIENKKQKLRKSMNTQSFSGTDQLFEKIEEIAASELLSDFVEDWSSLRTEYLRKRSAHERELVREGLRITGVFQQEFWNTYDLSNESILSISDQGATELIEKYASSAELDTIQKKIRMYMEDVNTLRLYREMLKSNLEKMAGSGRVLEKLVKQPGVKGQLEGFSETVLRVTSRDKTEKRPLSEYPVSYRIALTRWDREHINKREAFALGLASFLGGDLELAKLWLTEARERNVSRAELYLDEITRRTRSPREKTVQEFIESLKLAQSEGLRYALARIVHRLSFYDDTEFFQQKSGFINQVRADLPYDPDSFLDSSDLREYQEQLEQILTVYRTWLAGRVERGADLKTVQFTYEFQDTEELTDWSNTNESGLRSTYLQRHNAVRLSGEGMFLHDVSLTGEVTIHVELQDPESMKDTGTVLRWRENRGYRGMVNWTPLGTSSEYPAMGSTVLQKLQLPRSGNPVVSNARIMTMESVSSDNDSSGKTTEFQVMHHDGRLTLSMDDREVISTSDQQFKRGRSGLIFEGARRNIARIQVSGAPDRKWIDRKLESRGTTVDEIISQQSSNKSTSSGATSGQGDELKQQDGSGAGRESSSSGTGTDGGQEPSGTESSPDSPLDFQDVQPGQVAFAVNYGGDQVTEEGQTFIEDPFPDRGRDTEPGKISTNQRGSAPESLSNVFRSDRFGKDLTFVFPLSNGTYNVQFFFVEDWWNKPDSRVFDVYLQGEKIFENLDLYQETGKRHKGIKRTVKGVQVGDRKIKLRMNASVDNASISGLVIKRVK